MHSKKKFSNNFEYTYSVLRLKNYRRISKDLNKIHYDPNSSKYVISQGLVVYGLLLLEDTLAAIANKCKVYNYKTVKINARFIKPVAHGIKIKVTIKEQTTDSYLIEIIQLNVLTTLIELRFENPLKRKEEAEVHEGFIKSNLREISRILGCEVTRKLSVISRMKLTIDLSKDFNSNITFSDTFDVRFGLHTVSFLSAAINGTADVIEISIPSRELNATTKKNTYSKNTIIVGASGGLGHSILKYHVERNLSLPLLTCRSPIGNDEQLIPLSFKPIKFDITADDIRSLISKLKFDSTLKRVEIFYCATQKISCHTYPSHKSDTFIDAIFLKSIKDFCMENKDRSIALFYPTSVYVSTNTDVRYARYVENKLFIERSLEALCNQLENFYALCIELPEFKSNQNVTGLDFGSIRKAEEIGIDKFIMSSWVNFIEEIGRGISGRYRRISFDDLQRNNWRTYNI